MILFEHHVIEYSYFPGSVFTDLLKAKNYFDENKGDGFCYIRVRVGGDCVITTFSFEEYLHVFEFGSLDGFSV